MKIGIVGCAGRMGQMLLAEVLDTPGCELAGGSERPGGDAVGRDLGALIGRGNLGLIVGSDPAALFAAADTVIDFTTPAATVQHAALAAERRCALVIGTTGLSPEDIAQIDTAAKRTAIVRAGNMSLGVNILLALVEQVARALDGYDIEVLEMHHHHKVDAPSGTALMLGEAAAKGRGVDLAAVSQRVRDGITGPRKPGEIGFATLRGGDVIGEHTVFFSGEGERIEIGHKASSRRLFAAGAVRAAKWTAGRPPGHYSMRDVLGL